MKRSSILYVDDEESNLRGFKSLFFTDYEIFTAASGAEGLDILKNNEVQLIITDQKMPEMTGVEFLKEVAKKFPEPLRVILTGFSDFEVIVEAINECGIHRYINKPWNYEEMDLAIRRGLETYSLKKENEQLFNKLMKINHLLEGKVKELKS